MFLAEKSIYLGTIIGISDVQVTCEHILPKHRLPADLKLVAQLNQSLLYIGP